MDRVTIEDTTFAKGGPYINIIANSVRIQNVNLKGIGMYEMLREDEWKGLLLLNK